MTPKLPNINTKSPVFIYSLLVFLLVISANIFVPKSVWQKLFSERAITATVFQSTASGGNWNATTTWGTVSTINLTSPNGITFATSSPFFVANSGANNIFVINQDNSLATTTDVGLGLSNPFDVTLGATGMVYISDSGNNRIVILNPDLTLSTTTSAGLSNPQGIAVSPLGYVYISDFGNNRIVVLNANGTASTTYTIAATGSPTTFSGPKGIAISTSTGEIFIADSGNDRVVILNANGTASTTYDGGRLAPIHPFGMAVNTSSGIFYATDNTSNRVLAFGEHDDIVSGDYLLNFLFDSPEVGMGGSTTTTNSASSSDYGVVVGAIYHPSGSFDGSGYYEFSGGTTTQAHIYIQDPIPDSTELTLATWVYYQGGTDFTNTTNNGVGNIFSDSDPTGGNDLTLDITNSSIGIRADKSASLSYEDGTAVNMGANFFLNSWHFVAWTMTATTSIVFVDGVPKGTFNQTASNVGFHEDHAQIGRWSDAEVGSQNRFFEGFIDNFQFYNRALSPIDIGVLYNGSLGRHITTINKPTGIAIASSSDLFVSENLNNRVRVIDPVYGSVLKFFHNFSNPFFVPIEGIHYPGPSDDTIINTGTVTLTQDQNVHDLHLDPGGTLDLNGFTLHVYGNWINTGGTFLPNSGTVDFIGTGTQRILGTNTFGNLTKSASTSSSLLFDATNTTTITGSLSLFGSAGNLLTIVPASVNVVPQFPKAVLGTSARFCACTHRERP